MGGQPYEKSYTFTGAREALEVFPRELVEIRENSVSQPRQTKTQSQMGRQITQKHSYEIDSRLQLEGGEDRRGRQKEG